MKQFIRMAIVWLFVAVISATAQTPVVTPQAVEINVGSSILFTASPTNALQYQWQFNGSNIGPGTNSQLFLDNVGSNFAGSYTVVVTTVAGSVTSPPAVLTVLSDPIVTFTISNFPGGTESNVVVELFDHDKPATVANFIHYINSGAYSNMFFDRCYLSNISVLQGGTFDANDRTNTAPGLSIFPLFPQYELYSAVNPLPPQVASEFFFDSNTYTPNHQGTLAMALVSGDIDSASSAFFFNLVDNSALLDPQEFTVFGRVISGSNVLQFFNTLPNSSSDIIDYDRFNTNFPIQTLPVNYVGDTEPADVNLYFCDFEFGITNSPVYNTSIVPTEVVLFPTNGQVFTSGTNIVIQGTAMTNQWTGISRIYSDVLPETGIYAGYPFGNNAIGTTNWYLPLSAEFGDIPPGTYLARAVAQDGYGILGVYDVSNTFVILAHLQIITNGAGTISGFPGDYLNATGEYQMTAVPGPGSVFANWSNGSNATTMPTITINGLSDQILTVTFISNSLPSGFAITSPAKLTVTNATATFYGTLPAGVTVTQVVCRLFNGSSSQISQNAVISGSSWNVTITNLASLSYTLQAVATDSLGQQGVASQYVQLTPYNPDNMPKGISFLYPPPNANLEGAAITLRGRVPATLNVTQLVVQLYLQSNYFAGGGGPPTPPTWSLTVTNLSPGAYTAILTGYDKQGRSRAVSENFNIVGQVIVTNVGPGRIAGVRNGEYLVVGKKYSISAVPTAPGYIFGYWSLGVANTNASATTFIMEPGLALTATFVANPFPAVDGTYDGLFLGVSNTVGSTNCGAIAVNALSSGTFSGRLSLPGRNPSPFTGKFSYNGNATVTNSHTNLILLSLDLTNGTDAITGAVINQLTNGAIIWSNSLTAYRASKPGAGDPSTPGKYGLAFQPTTNSLIEDGYAAYTVLPSGEITLAGAIADGTTISEAVGASKSGIWPIYYAPPGYKGNALIGWQTNSATGTEGQLFWVKNGVTQILNSTGTNYAAPADGANYIITFTGGVLGSATMTNSLAVVGARLQSSGGLVITVGAGGVLSGHFSAAGATQTIKGIFSANGQSGAGFFINSGGQSGSFEISAAP